MSWVYFKQIHGCLIKLILGESKEMKKLLVVIACMILALAGVGVAFYGWLYWGWFSAGDAQAMNWEKQLESYNADLMIYGDVAESPEVTVNYRRIEHITDDILTEKGTKGYHCVVLYDLDGNMNLSDEELNLLREYCEKYYFDMVYFGTSFEQFRRCGYFQIIGDENRAFMYQGYLYRETEPSEDMLNPYLVLGIWSDEEEQELVRSGKKTLPFWKTVLDNALWSIELEE